MSAKSKIFNKNIHQQPNNKTLSWIWNNTKGYRIHLLALIIIDALQAVMSIWFAIACKKLVDNAVSKSLEELINSAILLVAIVMIKIAAQVVEEIIDEYARTKLRIKYQSSILKTLLYKDYESIADYHSGDFQTRLFSDVDVVVSAVVSIVPYSVYQICCLVGAIIVLLMLAPKLTLIFVFAGILLLSVMMMFRGKFKYLHKEMQSAEAKVRAFLQEILSSILVVKVFGAEKNILQKEEEEQRNYFNARMKRRTISIITGSGLSFIFSAGNLIALIWGCVSIFNGILTYGTLTAIIQLINQIQGPFSSFSGFVSQYYSAIASAERIIELEETKFESDNITLKRDDLYKQLDEILFENIRFSYGRNIVIDSMNLSIKKGDFVSITGESGGGKSTVFLLMLGAYHLTEGEIVFKTKDKDIYPKDMPGGVFAYVPQGNYLFSGTLRENITFLDKDKSDEEVMEALRIACAKQFVDEMPDGLDTVLGEKGHGLSEGQMQRIAVARAICSKAPILLLDEATSALDEATEAELLKNIQDLQNRTCIIVTHRKAALNICTKHITINNGVVEYIK